MVFAADGVEIESDTEFRESSGEGGRDLKVRTCSKSEPLTANGRGLSTLYPGGIDTCSNEGSFIVCVP